MLSKESKIYVAGHNGLVGSAIWNNLLQRGYTNLVGRSHKELDLTDLRLPSGATMRIRFENLTPMDIKKLDEFFMDMLGVAKVSDNTEGYITIQDTSDEEDELIKELKKQGD